MNDLQCGDGLFGFGDPNDPFCYCWLRFFCVKNVVSTHLGLRFSDVYQVFEATRLGDPPETNIKTAGFVVWESGRGGKKGGC